MSTRSSIAVLQPDGKVKSIYCHWDGYLKGGVGQTLFEDYNSEEKANELISLGGLSRLDKYPNPLEEAIADYSMDSGENKTGKKLKASEHSYNSPQKEVTVAYHRDRGEKFSQNIHRDLEMYNLTGDFQSCNYLFKDGKWHVQNGKGWIEITEELIKN